MSIFSKRVAAIEAAETISAGFVSPSENDNALAYVTYAEHFALTGKGIVNRPIAMTVGAVSRGRALITGGLANAPLRALRNGEPVPIQPAWLYRTNTTQSPYLRMVWTVDDLIFHGNSLWLVERGADGKKILDAWRVPRGKWEMDDEGRIKVDNQPVSASEVLFFQGSQDALISSARNTILGALALEQAWIGRAQNPIPALVFSQTERDALEDEDVRGTVDAWSAARTSPTGAIGFVPYGLKAEALGTSDTGMFEKARNAIRLDIANFLNVPASMLEGSANSASLTYENKATERNAFVDTTLRFWAGPIEARLSMDDVVPAGQSVRFDFASLIDHPAPATGAPVED